MTGWSHEHRTAEPRRGADVTPKNRKDNRAWAKDYADLGWKVLPLHSPRNGTCSCGRSLDHKGAAKHPHTRNGVKDATTDPAKIDGWLDKWPDANVGVACGAGSGIDTIDIDVQKGADLNALGKLPPGPVFKTGGGGLQYVYLHLNGQGPSVGKLAEHVDVRGEGSYFVAPPSIHASGEPYRWRKGPRTPLQPFPRFSASSPRSLSQTMSAALTTVPRRRWAVGMRPASASPSSCASKGRIPRRSRLL